MKFIGLCVVSIVAISLCSCGADVDLLPNQKDGIVKYLETKTMEYTIQNGVYKHIANMNRVGYETAPMAHPGDSISYSFEAYTFTSEPNSLFYTNKPRLIDTLGTQGLNTTYWPRESMKIKVGATPLIKGLANGIPYCRQGDSVLLFITSDLAYDKKSVGIVESNTPIVYILTIENVKK